MKVYFAHSIEEYGSERELSALKVLREKFCSDEVECPNNDLPQMRGMDAYLKYVKENVDILVFMPKENGWCGRGTYSEIRTAQEKGIPVFVARVTRQLLPRTYKTRIIDKYSFKEINEYDWKNYAKVF